MLVRAAGSLKVSSLAASLRLDDHPANKIGCTRRYQRSAENVREANPHTLKALREHGIGTAPRNLIDKRLRQKLRVAGYLFEEIREVQIDVAWLADTGTLPCSANTKAVRQFAPKEVIVPHGSSEGEGERSRGEFICAGAVTGLELDEVNGALTGREQAAAESVSFERQPMAVSILADDEVGFDRVVLSG